MKKNKLRKKMLIFGIFFLLCLSSNGQISKGKLKLSVRHLDKSDNLPDNHVNNTFIDAKGCIWFLTNNVLSKFENGKINNFVFSNSFSNKGFNQIVEDASGNFILCENFEWFYPFNIQRIVVLNHASKKVYSFDQYLKAKLNGIHSIISDKNGLIYISTKNGEVFKFESTKKHLSKVISLAKTPVKLLFADKDEIIACSEVNSIFDSHLFRISPIGKPLQKYDVAKKLVKSIIKTENQTYFIFEQNSFIGIEKLGSKIDKIFKVSKDGYLGNISFDQKNKLFILNKGNGIDFLNKNLELIYTEDYDFLIHQVVYDKHGNGFLATNKGLKIIRLLNQNIKTFLENPDPNKVNENYSCRAILKVDNNQLIVNTNQKRQLINLKTGIVKPLGNSIDPSSIDNKFTLSILKDNDNQILFGEDILYKTDLKTGKNKALISLDSTKIWSMVNYKNGILLGLEKKGIIFYDQKEGLVQNYTINDLNLKNSIIYDFYVMHENLVLVASEAGLYYLKNNKEFEVLNLPPKNQGQISFFSIKKDGSQLLLASSQGIWEFDIATKNLKPFIKDKIFRYKKFFSAYRTQNGIWASSEEGVWHFDNKGFLLKIFSEIDGLSSKECNRLAHFKDENGILYFGGVNGLNVINPLGFSSKKEVKLPIKIRSITTYSDQVRKRNLEVFDSKILNLLRNENGLAIELGYEDYKYDCSKIYYYRNSKSVNKEWQAIKDNILNFDYVSRGLTTIEIKVVSCNDFAEEQLLTFTIFRPKPIYLEWYSIIAFFILLGFLFFVFNKYSTYKLRKRNESLERKIAKQTKSLQENLDLKEKLLSMLVHDVRYPVQSFYDISKKLAYLTKRNDQDRLILLGKETEEKSRKVLWMIDELVYWVKSTNDKNEIVFQNKHIGDFINQVLEVYEDEIKNKNIKVKLINNELLLKADYGILFIILRNLLFNSILHSKTGTEIWIECTVKEGVFCIEIQNLCLDEQLDNQGLGIGLSLLSNMLEKSNIKLLNWQDHDIYTARIEINTL